MKIQHILEARRNPELNKKQTVHGALRRRMTVNGMMLKSRHLFVSFTDIDKLGINPRSEYATPLGIYAYPASYVRDVIKDDRSTSHLPFAGSCPYANIFSVDLKSGVISLGEVDEYDADRYTSRIRGLIRDEMKKGDPKLTDVDLSHRVSAKMDEIFRAAESDGDLDLESYGSRIWNYTRYAAKLFFAEAWRSTPSRAWNAIFRKIGINGCTDEYGEGIIHPSEPTQAVFFTMGIIHDVERIQNGLSPQERKQRSDYANPKGESIRLLAKSPSRQLATDIQYISNPTSFLELAELRPEALEYIFQLPERTLRAVYKLKGLPFVLERIASGHRAHSSATRILEWLLDQFGEPFARACVDGYSHLAEWEVELINARYPELSAN